MARGFKQWLFSETDYRTDLPTGTGMRLFGLALSLTIVIFAIAGAIIMVVTALR